MRWSWRLDASQCTGCGVCADVCPHEAIRMPREAAFPEVVDDLCTACRLCARECPFDAIEIAAVSDTPPTSDRPAQVRPGTGPRFPAEEARA